jgi:hypothetical protein
MKEKEKRAPFSQALVYMCVKNISVYMVSGSRVVSV